MSAAPGTSSARPGSAAPVAIAAATGIALWYLTSALTGKREPWDASPYWTAAYPIALFVSAALGYFYPDRPWRWVLVLFEIQLVAMWVRSGEPGNLWPIGMAIFVVIALPGIAAARLTVWLRARLRPEEY